MEIYEKPQTLFGLSRDCTEWERVLNYRTVTDKENWKTMYFLFFILTKESLRVYILLTLSGVRELKKTSYMFILFREASTSSGYSEGAFVVCNATRRADSFFTNGISSDTTASDLLD